MKWYMFSFVVLLRFNAGVITSSSSDDLLMIGRNKLSSVN